MLVSVDWLKEYVDIELPPEEVAHRLTMAGLEVEHIDWPGQKYKGFIVGRVLEVAPHPNADRLKVTKVNTGKEVLQIVCGAPNVGAGQKVIVGLAGAVVPRNQHDPDGIPFELSRVSIRGVESAGMICSAYELAIGDDKDGIVVLHTEAKVGTPLSTFLGLDGMAFEVGITPNRVDAMSHIGIAREIAALTSQQLKFPETKVEEGGKSASSAVKITIENPEDCPRYTARVVTGIAVKESPEWLQNRLKMVGLRPINNIVDVSNYVLMEIGHPIHAFDYDLVAGHEIRVRRAKAGESFTTLDQKARKLSDTTLMICDGEKPVAIAGVMGGLNSEISAKTKNVLIEGAYFSPQSVRRTSKFLALSTDASQRFERGADPNRTEWAVDRVAHLIQTIAGGEVLKGRVDAYPAEIEPKKISVRVKKANDMLGTNLDAETVAGLLEKIEIEAGSAKGKDLTIEVKAPTFRPDLEREIDIIEEIARLYGYDNIATERRVSIQLGDSAPPLSTDDMLRAWFAGRGFREAYAHSLVDEQMAKMGDKTAVELANPNSKEMAVMRTCLAAGLLRIAGTNMAHGNKDLRLFELGKVYGKAAAGEKTTVAGYSEEARLCVLLSGKAQNPSWGGVPDRVVDVFDLKGELEALFGNISLDKFNFIPYTTSNALSDGGADIDIYGAKRGYFGK